MDRNFAIKSAEFRTSVADIGTYGTVSATYECPEVCVAGRSNVGKSSFINLLACRNKLAKTSSTPGRTRLLNLFDFTLIQKINGEADGETPFVLVDLPGYGYAEAQKTKIETWSRLIDSYFAVSKKLRHVFSLVDIRHEPSKQDRQMVQFLYASGLPFTIIATKIDKIPKAKLAAHVQIIASALAVGKDNIIPTSFDAKVGRDAVANRIGQVLTTGIV